MTQPVAYDRQADFTKNHNSIQNDTLLNAELDGVATSVNGIRENLAIIQSDDGGLKAGILGKEHFTEKAYTEFVDEVVDRSKLKAKEIREIAEKAKADADAAKADAKSAREDADAAREDADRAARTAADIQENLPSDIEERLRELDIPHQVEEEVSRKLLDLAVDERLNSQAEQIEEGLGQIPHLVDDAVDRKDVPHLVEDAVDGAIDRQDIPGQVKNAVDGRLLQVSEELTQIDGQLADFGERLSHGLAEGVEAALGYMPADDATVLKHAAQELSEEQKRQARENVDAQKALTFDETPTAESANPVTSGGVHASVDALGKEAVLKTGVNSLKPENHYQLKFKNDSTGDVTTFRMNESGFVINAVDFNPEDDTEGAYLCLRPPKQTEQHVGASFTPGAFLLGARKKGVSDSAETYEGQGCRLAGNPNGTLTWCEKRVISAPDIVSLSKTISTSTAASVTLPAGGTWLYWVSFRMWSATTELIATWESCTKAAGGTVVGPKATGWSNVEGIAIRVA